MRAPSRGELRRHVVETRIAGDVMTPRASNVANIDKMLERRWDYWFGLDLDRAWTSGEVLKVVAARCGIDADPDRTTGGDRIDPDLLLDALDEAASRLAHAARHRLPVLVATGHPTGVLSLHLAVAAALRAAGCDVIEPCAGGAVVAEHLPPRAQIRYLGGVAMLSNGADFLHTHAPEPMQQILASGARPGLVLADHGWAGAAAAAGLEVVGLADTNDPALFVGAEEGKVGVVVPLDDNVAPAAYDPLAAYLIQAISSTRAH